MDGKFEKISSTQRALILLRKFELLRLDNLGIHEKYQRILQHYRYMEVFFFVAFKYLHTQLLIQVIKKFQKHIVVLHYSATISLRHL